MSRVLRRATTAGTVVLLSGAGALAGSAPAQAAQRERPVKVTECNRTFKGKAATLHVSTGATCILDGARVGAVVLDQGGTLLAYDSTVATDVTWQQVAFTDLNTTFKVRNTSIGGSVSITGASDLVLDHSRVGGDLRMSGDPLYFYPDALVYSSTVVGQVYSDFGWVKAVNSTLGSIRSITGHLGSADLFNSVVLGEARFNTFFACGTTFGANLSAGVAWGHDLGTNDSECGGNTIAGNLTLTGSDFPERIAANTVHGTASSDAPEVWGSANSFLGGATGTLTQIQEQVIDGREIPEAPVF